MPPFARIQPEDFGPALAHAMSLHRAEMADIGANPAPPDLHNTVAPIDRAGALLARVEAVLHNLTASATSQALQAVQRDTAGPLAAHWSAVLQDPAVYHRLNAVYQQRDQLPPEPRRLTERLHADCQRAGAHLAPAARLEFGQLAEQLAQLTTAFGQNVLHDEAAWLMPLPDEAAQAGLPDFLLAAARQAANERGLPHPVITLSRGLVMPFLTHSTRRDLREVAWRAWVGRGEQAGAQGQPAHRAPDPGPRGSARRR